MSKTASPAVLGGFVVAAFALALGAVLLLAGGRYFRHTARVITYFDASVNGLRVGAPVKFRGIEIGSVHDVRINMSGALRDAEHVRIPVVLEIDEERVTSEGVAGIDLRDPDAVTQLVAHGLRAELETESLLTGIRYVALDVKPKTPARLVHDPAVAYPEIPSLASARDRIPDQIGAVLTNLARVDVEGLTTSLKDTVDEAHRLLSSPGLARAVNRLDNVTATLDRTIADLQPGIQSLSPLSIELRDTATSARVLLAPDGRLAHKLDAMVEELTSTARSLRRLSDHLERDPGSLLRGGRQ